MEGRLEAEVTLEEVQSAVGDAMILAAKQKNTRLRNKLAIAYRQLKEVADFLATGEVV
jgi:hypothetical protein